MSSFSSSSENQGSESRSNPNPKWIYDVFLSFRGEDTRHNFTAHLYAAFRRRAVNVFRDDDVLRSGDQILLQAIEGSRVSIIIFSRNYASSRWCLQELEKIMECRRTMGQVVVPVFYHVDPSEVRHQTGNFGEALDVHSERMTQDKVMSWRAALREAGDISGIVVMKFGDESEGIENIVERVIHLLDSTDVFVAEHQVALQSRVEDVIQLLNYQNSNDVRVIGIWGMGGIGKTTLAGALYNQIAPKFEGRSFLPNIREAWKEDARQVYLQERLLSNICNTTTVQIHSIESGKTILKERLRHKRVLIVLDDVNELEQLNALCGSHEWFGPGSRIIITTRDKHLLSEFGVDHVYRIEYLDFSESLELFSRTAFNQASPREEFADLSKNAVDYAGGIPLALEVLGTVLKGKGAAEWKTVLERLKTNPNNRIENALKISFDDLDDDRLKEIFLDIACFFIGMDFNDVKQKLNGYGDFAGTGIVALTERSLVTIDEKNKLGMHDLLQKLGREIVRKESLIEDEFQPRIYDVFLSFRGVDTRATFTSHLHTSLENAGIYVFKDDDAIPRGDRIKISLLQAIGGSRVAIIVFSINYANSRWCLQELENIMECSRTKGQVVVPVFYGVDPSEVRHQSGKFGEKFKDLLRKISVEADKVLSWKRSLREAGGIAGFVIIDSRNESEDVKKVIEHVTRLLDRTDLFVAANPVGVKSRVQDVIKLLKLDNQQSKDVLLLGIWGIGGMGKTTIAKAIYNKIGRDFEGRSFLPNIREAWEQDNGQVSLQERLLFDVYKTTKIRIHTTDSGKITLKERLPHKRVLLVLDDVNKREQLEALCGSHEWFGPGSRIIITTRDEHLLRVPGVKHVYKIKKMDESESTELFSWHAFKQASPKEDFAALSGDVVAYSGGLPLALEVLGSFLFDREVTKWKSVLDKLKCIPNKEVLKKLRISFDDLNDDTEKEIFLDIACFFIGMDQNEVIQILDGCGHFAEIGVSVLVDRSLVTIDNKNKLGMHDLLRDMGRAIVRETAPQYPEERSRLLFEEDVVGVLSKHTGTKAVRGLALKLLRMKSFDTKAFKKMSCLRLLQLAGVELVGDFKYLSRDLRWLCWHRFPLRYTPANFYQGNLVALELRDSNLKLLWQEAKLLETLIILNLSHSHQLTQTPDFSYLPNLEKLVLKDCRSLLSVSHTVGHLKKLLVINLKDCTSLPSLPRSIYKLKSLKTLILSGCTMIDRLEEDLEQMESLAALIADKTAITQVPFSVIRSKSIAYISLCGFEGFSRDVFPSIIMSWMSPTNNLSSLVPTSAGMSSLISIAGPNNNSHCLSTTFKDLPKLPSLYVGCGSELQPTGEVARILETLCATNCYELDTMSSQVSNTENSALIECRSKIHISGSKNSLKSLLIQMGMKGQVFNILKESISQELTTRGPRGSFLLPDDNYPDWLTFNCDGSSVVFEMPTVKGRKLKRMALCIVYSSSPDNITSGLRNVLIINHTKTTIQMYKRDTLNSFEDEEWQSLISNLEPGNKVEVIVVFSYGFIVNKTAVYLTYDEPTDEKMEHYHAADNNFICFGGDDMPAYENITIPCGDDMAINENVSVFGSDDVVARENVIVSSGDGMIADKNIIVSGSDDMATKRKNEIVFGGDDGAADKSVDDFNGDDMAANKNVSVFGGGDIAANMNEIISRDDDMAADMNVTVSGNDDTTVDMSEIVFDGDDTAADKSVIVCGDDDLPVDKNVTVSGDDDTTANMNEIVSDGVDMAADKNVNVWSDDDMPVDKNVIPCGGDEHRFRGFFTLPSFVRAILISRSFWIGLAIIFVWTCRRSYKRSRNLISRYTLRWKWLVDCIDKLTAYRKANKAHFAIESNSRIKR